MIKTLHASGIEGKYYNIIKTTYQESTAMSYSSFMLKRFKRTFPQGVQWPMNTQKLSTLVLGKHNSKQ
jgi:hypothetical protein